MVRDAPGFTETGRAPRPPGAPLRALVLDDDGFDRRRLTKMISALPVPVTSDSAATLAELDSRVRERDYDVVFVDYTLTDGTGLDALRILRTAPGAEGRACVMVTGTQDAEIAAACFRDGCRDFITKSNLSPDTLNTTLQRLHRPEPEILDALPPLHLMRPALRDLAAALGPELRQTIRETMAAELRDTLRDALAEFPVHRRDTEDLIANLLGPADDFVFR